MKIFKLLYLLILVSIVLNSHGQSSDNSSEFLKNEVGTDMTLLLNQFFNFNENSLYFQSPYRLTYKRRFNKFNIRAGINGSYYQDSITDSFTDEKLNLVFGNLNYRIGIEKYLNLSERWNFYFGLDFRHNYSVNTNSSTSYSNGWLTRRSFRTHQFGVAPIMGFEFNINDHFALQTEANFTFFQIKEKVDNKVSQYNDFPTGERPVEGEVESTNYRTEFVIPSFLNLVVKF